MRVMVKLTGSLGKYIEGYDKSKSIEVELSANAQVKDLIGALRIPPSEALFVTRSDMILSQSDLLRQNDALTVVQAFEGG